MQRILLLFALCSASLILPAQDSISITFNVGTSGIIGTVNTIQLAGGSSFGAPGENPLSDDDDDGVYTITVRQPVGFSSFYTFTNGPCSDYACKENIAGQACANPNNFNDRFLTAVSQDTVINTCFGACTDDLMCAPPETAMVTFQVDLSEVEQAYTTPGVVGTFNGFDANANPMTDTDGDSIWTATIEIPLGPIQFKFQADNYALDESLSPDQPCAMDFGGFVNRVDTIVGDTVLAAVCFASCEACSPVSTYDPSVYGISLDLRPTLVSDQLLVDLRQPPALQSMLQVFSVGGQLLETRAVRGTAINVFDVSQLASGAYFLRLTHRDAVAVRRFVKR